MHIYVLPNKLGLPLAELIVLSHFLHSPISLLHSLVLGRYKRSLKTKISLCGYPAELLCQNTTALSKYFYSNEMLLTGFVDLF